MVLTASPNLAKRFDRACRLVSQPSGERRLFQVLAGAEHYLSPIQAERLHSDTDLARSR
jgi:hypothetical protein